MSRGGHVQRASPLLPGTSSRIAVPAQWSMRDARGPTEQRPLLVLVDSGGGEGCSEVRWRATHDGRRAPRRRHRSRSRLAGPCSEHSAKSVRAAGLCPSDDRSKQGRCLTPAARPLRKELCLRCGDAAMHARRPLRTPCAGACLMATPLRSASASRSRLFVAPVRSLGSTGTMPLAADSSSESAGHSRTE